MARLYLLLFLLQIALAVAALISCLSAEEGEVNAIPRLWWILIILFFPLVGSIAWFMVGRNRTRPANRPRPGAPRPPRGGRSEPRRPLAPDDDPDFLRSLKPRPEEHDDDHPKS